MFGRRCSLIVFIQLLNVVSVVYGDCIVDGSCQETAAEENKYKKPILDKMSAKTERTFIMVKPDGVQRGLVPVILSRFTQRGFKLVAMKMVKPSEEFARQHYDDLKAKPFFAGLTKFLSSGPCVATVWEGKGAVATGRHMLGETDPFKSKPGSIRGDFCIDIGRNVIHGSDAVDSAQREIALWFKPEELIDWTPTMNSWVYE